MLAQDGSGGTGAVLTALLARHPLPRCARCRHLSSQGASYPGANGGPTPLEGSQQPQASSSPRTRQAESAGLLLRHLTPLRDQGCMQTFALICKMIHIIREKS